MPRCTAGAIVGVFALGAASALWAAALRDSVRVDSLRAVLPSPTGALLRSLVLPGWGQWYAQAYWKAPVFLVGNALCAVLTVVNQRRYAELQRQIADASASNADAIELFRLRALRDAYAQRRDLALAGWVLAYLLAAVDAYVSAHLAGFDVSEQLSCAPLPSPSGGAFAVQLRLTLR